MRDTYYKDSMMEVLKEHCTDEDVIIWSDLDEVPNPEVIERFREFYNLVRSITLHKTTIKQLELVRDQWHYRFSNSRLLL